MANVRRFGSFGLEDEVISDAEIRRFCTVVNSADDLPNISDRTTAVVATKFTYRSATLLPGDVLINNGTIWEKLSDVKKTDFRNCLNPPSKFRGYIVGDRVFLKWNDPDNTFITDSTDQRVDTAIWKETILVRKFGSEPQSMFDGTRVLIETSKDAYSDEYFTDVIPVGIDVQVYYKLYAVAHTGVITESSAIAPNVFTWENVSAELNKEDSRIRDMFAAGDVITITSNDSSVDLVVMGIDNVDKGSGNHHTMTFAFKYIESGWIGRQHDNNSLYEFFSRYRRTADAETKRGKTYFYKKNNQWQNGWYCQVDGTMPDEGLSINDLYEFVTGWDPTDGIAAWDKSFISVYINSKDSGSPYRVINGIDPDLASRIIETKVKSVVDGSGTTVETFQKFFIPSTTEVYDLKSSSIAEGKLLEYFEQFITEDDHGKKFDPAGFLWTKQDGTICVWWTRSISRSDVSRGYVVDATNPDLFTTSNAKESKACVVMFTIGQKQS